MQKPTDTDPMEKRVIKIELRVFCTALEAQFINQHVLEEAFAKAYGYSGVTIGASSVIETVIKP